MIALTLPFPKQRGSMASFEELGLGAQALAAVKTLGYEAPTPVQEQAIPLVLDGCDIIAAAQTGTGKTAAFSLPILDKLGHARKGAGPLALVVTPTRELAMQIEDVCLAIAKHTGHKVACLVGGVAYGPQVELLAKGCDILVSTPGRLLDLMGQGAAHLNQVQALVLDEADRMLDMGFLPDVRRIVGACPAQRQTLLFSATIDEGIQRNMANLLHDPAYVEIAHKGETARLVAQYRIDVDHRMKQDLLHALLREKGGCRIIVFARTRHRVDSCVRKLRREGFSAAPLHSDRTQNQRKRALEAFAADEVDVLVATDVLARGIDISNVNYVVNFDVPTQAEDYVHRIGRTGRAGESGFSVTFVTPDNTQELAAIEKLIGREIPYLELNWDASEKNDETISATHNRRAARKDPEIAQAMREEAARKKRRAKRAGSSASQPGRPAGREKGRTRSVEARRADSAAKGNPTSQPGHAAGKGAALSRSAKAESIGAKPAKRKPSGAKSTGKAPASTKSTGRESNRRGTRRRSNRHGA